MSWPTINPEIMKEERETIVEFIAKIDEIIKRKGHCHEITNETENLQDNKKSVEVPVEEEWSENKYNFMRKYGHI